MSQLTVQTCTLKKSTDTYKVYEITDAEGKKYDSFKEIPPGTHEVEITPNGNYNPKIKLIGKNGANGWAGNKGATKAGNESFAMSYAKDLVVSGKIEIGDLSKYADKIYDWLQSKKQS